MEIKQTPTTVQPKTHQEIINQFIGGEIDAIECVWLLHGTGVERVSRVTQTAVRTDVITIPKKREILNRAGSAIDAYVDIEPYLNGIGVYDAIELLGERTQEEIFKFYAMMERCGVKEKIKERTKRNISFSTLMYVLMVGKKVPWEKDAQSVVQMGAVYERSKARILRDAYDKLQKEKDRRAHTAVHFAWVLQHNWNLIRRDRTVRDTYRDRDKMPREPWSISYGRLIHAAIKADCEYAKGLEKKV